jgi:hypothetical protein
MLKDNISQLFVKIGESKIISNIFIIVTLDINADKYLIYIVSNKKSYIITKYNVWNVEMYR